MPFPIVYERVEQSFSTASTSHSVTMPTTVVENRLLLMVVSGGDNTAADFAITGWTKEKQQSINAAEANTLAILKKVADGTEGGTSVSLTNTVSMTAVTHTFEIGNFHSLTMIETDVAVVAGSTTSHDPPSNDPAQWNNEEALYIAGVALADDDSDVTVFPTNYTNTQVDTSGAGANAGCSLATCRRELQTAFGENPSAFTSSLSEQGNAFTLAIRPAASQIDTAAKQQCALNWVCGGGIFWHNLPPASGGAFDQADQQHLLNRYCGILFAGAPAVVGIPKHRGLTRNVGKGML